jgi:hypothetical protein
MQKRPFEKTQILTVCALYPLPTVPPGGELEVTASAADPVTLIDIEPVSDDGSVAVMVCVPAVSMVADN